MTTDLYLTCTSYLLQLSIYQKQNWITWYSTTLLDIVPQNTWFCNGVWLWISRKTGEWRPQCVLQGKLTITLGQHWIEHEMVKASSGMVFWISITWSYCPTRQQGYERMLWSHSYIVLFEKENNLRFACEVAKFLVAQILLPPNIRQQQLTQINVRKIWTIVKWKAKKERRFS